MYNSFALVPNELFFVVVGATSTPVRLTDRSTLAANTCANEVTAKSCTSVVHFIRTKNKTLHVTICIYQIKQTLHEYFTTFPHRKTNTRNIVPTARITNDAM